MARLATSPPYLGRINWVSSEKPNYGWSNSFWVKGTSTAVALENLKGIKDLMLAMMAYPTVVTSLVVSNNSIKGDSLNAVLVNDLVDWGDPTVHGAIGTEMAPGTALHPDFALLVRENVALGVIRNFIYIKGIPSTVYKANGGYQASLAAGFADARDAFFAGLITNAQVVGKDHSDNTVKALAISGCVDERIVRRKSGRPSDFTVVGRRKLR